MGYIIYKQLKYMHKKFINIIFNFCLSEIHARKKHFKFSLLLKVKYMHRENNLYIFFGSIE